MTVKTWETNCRLCPRDCGADRTLGTGFCGAGNKLKVARAALHFYEEPFLSGQSGSGAVFFSGCSLRCIYCQNYQISGGGPECKRNMPFGIEITTERLTEIFFELKEKGALNINLVTGTHFAPLIAEAVSKAKEEGFDLPFVWNSSGYERTETLKLLEDLVDIWLPDLKTLDETLASRYLHAPDYPIVAKAALDQMVKMAAATQKQMANAGPLQMDRSEEALKESEDGLLRKGVCVRHLMTPGNLADTIRVIDYLADTYGDTIWFSLMSQYTPMGKNMPMGRIPFPELNRKVDPAEYEKAVDHVIARGMENCMIQEGDAAEESFIPAFDGEGVLHK